MANIHRDDEIIISWGESVEPVTPDHRLMSGQVTDLRYKVEFGVQGEAELRTFFIDFDELFQRYIRGNSSSDKAEQIRTAVCEYAKKKLLGPRIPENNEHFFFQERDFLEFVH